MIATEAVEPDPNDAFTGQEFYEDTGTLPEGDALEEGILAFKESFAGASVE